MGDGGTGGTKVLGVNDTVPWLIGNRVGTVPVARAYAQAVAATVAATPASSSTHAASRRR